MRRGEESSLTGMLEVLEQTLSQMNSRLTELENRLNQVETGQVLMDEQHIPAKTGQFGGKTLLTSTTGAVQREVRVTFCDVCGKRSEEEGLALCYVCGRKVCADRCLVKLGANFLCIECLKGQLPLSKKEFKVLIAIANEITNIYSISNVSSIEKDRVRASIARLLHFNLIVKRGVSIFSTLQITDEGLEALAAYRQVYTDEDVAQFEAAIQKNLSELSGK